MVFLGPNSIGSVYGPSGYAVYKNAANRRGAVPGKRAEDDTVQICKHVRTCRQGITRPSKPQYPRKPLNCILCTTRATQTIHRFLPKERLWPSIVGIWGILEGSWGV